MDVARSDTAGVDPGSVSTDPGPRADAPRGRSVGLELLVLGAVAVAVTLLVRVLLVQAFYIPSASMQPSLDVGDRVLVSKLAYRFGDVARGDVVVFDGRGSLAPAVDPTAGGLLTRLSQSVGSILGVSVSERDYVKRVVGLPGDRVACCDTGRLTVNGSPLTEPYVMPGDAPSDQPFDVVVPAGRLWVMGDHRSDSADSRAHLGDPGGGTVPIDRVVGRVTLRFWPLGRLGTSPTSAARS